ncbi:MAG: hypothetical protein AAB526_00630, partial [Patescibacteria group bacterium]
FSNVANAEITSDSTTMPSVTVLSPNGGEILEFNKPYDIAWKAFNLTGMGNIYLEQNDSMAIIIAENIDLSLGKYSWTAAMTGGNLKIYVGLKDRSVFDRSDLSFSVTQGTQYLSLFLDPSTPVSQNIIGGSTEVSVAMMRLTAGNAEDIKINNIIVADKSQKVSYQMGESVIYNVKIYDGTTQIGATSISLDAKRQAYFNNLNWIIPKATSKALTIKISVNSSAQTGDVVTMGIISIGANSVSSGQNITISNSVYGYDMPFISSVTPSITLLSPNRGDEWRVGDTKKISWWNDSNINYVKIYIYDSTIFGSGSTNYIYDGSVPANQGYYDWTIQQNQLPGGGSLPRKYQISIDGRSSKDSTISVSDSSDGFTIMPGIEQSPVVITFPNRTTILKAGETFNFTWTGYNSKNVSYYIILRGQNQDSSTCRPTDDQVPQRLVSCTIPKDAASGSNYQIEFSG